MIFLDLLIWFYIFLMFSSYIKENTNHQWNKCSNCALSLLYSPILKDIDKYLVQISKWTKSLLNQVVIHFFCIKWFCNNCSLNSKILLLIQNGIFGMSDQHTLSEWSRQLYWISFLKDIDQLLVHCRKWTRSLLNQIYGNTLFLYEIIV